MKYLIADLVTEFTIKYSENLEFAKPFEYHGERVADIKLSLSDDEIKSFLKRAVEGTTLPAAENFLYSGKFNRAAINFGTMLVHSSALVYDGGAYLFSGDSGVGKSTHTKLWLKAFGDKVHIMNDDKPVVKLYENKAVAFGTPFDGGSSIALNESYPLKAIIFIEQGDKNSVRVPESKEIIQKLYFQTARMVDRKTAERMLVNIERILSLTKFYVLTCNTDISAAHTAFEKIIGT